MNSAILRLILAIVPRFLQFCPGHTFLLGPRGTGKSLWTRHLFPDALVVDLLNPEILRRCLARPEYLLERVEALGDKFVVIVGEIQKAPALLDVLHLLVEKKSGHRFILTGSSARKLRREGTNLLGGRAGQKKMHPYMAAELGSDFQFERALEYGLIPLIWHSINPQETMQAYNGLYLREEVQMGGLVRNLGAFARFLEAASFSHGAVLNMANISRECQVARKTVEGYLEILRDLLLADSLPVFTRKAKRELAAHPKFYFFDVALYRANGPQGPLDRPEEIHGPALEGLVGQHLRAWCDYQSAPHQLYYWQTRSQVEVDFVVYGPTGLWALEVKNSPLIQSKDLSGLKTFQEDYPEATCIFLYRGKEKLLRQNIYCWPVDEFLRALTPSRFPEGAQGSTPDNQYGLR